MSTTVNSQNWRRVKLAEVADIVTGYTFKSAEYSENPKDIRLVRGDNVIQKSIRWEGVKYWPQSKIDGLELYWLQPGDVILAMDRPWIEAGLKYARITEFDVPALLVQRVMRLRGTAELDSGFLYYVIGNPRFTAYILSITTGTAVPHISGPDIRKFEFVLPPLPIQREIAHILGSLDDKIDLNRRMNATLESMACALFKSWFVDFDPVRAKAEGRQPDGIDADTAALFPDSFEDSALGPIPAGWRVAHIGELAEFAYGKPLRADNRIDGEFPVFGSNGIVGSHNEYLVIGPGLVIGRKGNPGTVMWSESNFFPIDTTFYAIPTSNLPLRFLFYMLLNQDLASLSADSAVPGLNRNIAYLNKVVVPPAGLVCAFDNLVSSLMRKIYLNDRETITLAVTRDALLPRLMSGEVTV
jgi:type I restriction enzyme S subunit